MKKITGLLKRMLCLVLCAMMALGCTTTTYADWNHVSKKTWKKAVKKAKKKYVLKPTNCTLEGDWSDWADDDPHYMIDFDDLIAGDEGGCFTVSIEADEPVMTRVICREQWTVGGGQEYFDLSFDEPVKEYKPDDYGVEPSWSKYAGRKHAGFYISDRSNVYFIVETTDPDVEVRVTVKGVKSVGKKPAKFVIDRWATSEDWEC